MNEPSFARSIERAALPVVVLLLLLLPAPASAASPAAPVAYDPFFYGGPAASSTPAVAADGSVAPLASVSGWITPYDPAVTPQNVIADSYDESGNYLGGGFTSADDNGYYAIDELPTGGAQITATFDVWGHWLKYENVNLAEGENTVSFLPGAVRWYATLADLSNKPSTLRVVVGGWNDDYGTRTLSGQWLWDPSSTRVAWALPGEISWGQCYFEDNEVSIWASEDVSYIPVAAGELSSGSMFFSQADAARMWIVRPRWRSGNPGTVMKVRLANWPQYTRLNLAGWDASFPVTTWGGASYDVSTNPTTATYNLKVPTSATVGKFFMTVGDGLTTDHAAPTTVSTLFQTSRFSATRTRISKGRTVRLRGRVPVWERGDTGMGARKYVTIWARARSASDAPALWNPTKLGWRKVATVRTDRYGKFVSRALRPKRSTTYVCRYPGDGIHFRAYTSPARVTVR